MIRAAVVGATGIVGQQFLVALKGHPWIEVKALAASERSAGQSYRKAITDPATGAVRWFCDEPPVEDVMDMPVVNATELSTNGIDLVFSAIESGPAKTLEPQYAAEVPVISTASAFRYEDDVPILIPGVNPGHARLLAAQRKRRGWKGFITPNPNCTTIGLAVTLKPIYDAFGLNSVIMTSMQAMSGAGRSPGVIGLDILDNVIPFIPGEEDKVQRETQKILGVIEGDAIRPAPFVVSCSCSRVCVLEGHTEAVFASTRKPADVASVIKAMREYDGGLAGLPSAPAHLIHVSEDPFRPQPRLDRDNEGGMATTVGRVRQDAALPNGIKYVLVSHNTKMGAARGAVLEAEMLIHDGYIG
ncbi:MAG: aspartate-semialdehyde dehydrogenase [Dehalococcoidia bacterium]|jgi:aspartate-semialdehyde dehydrogenase|nr:aspartate-semialdehyde dehydrogenase [Dehalococcoidia bacterium]